MRSIRGRLSAALAAGALVLALAPVWLASPAPARATEITVTTTEDVISDDGQCSLREAIIAANENTAVDTCPAGEPFLPGSRWDHINLMPGTYRLAIEGTDEDAAATGDLDILEPLTIGGDLATHDPSTTVIDGAGLDRVFDVHPSAGTLHLRDLTVTGGVTDGEGGGIRIVDQPADPPECTAVGGGTVLWAVIVRNNSAGMGGGVSVGTCTDFESELESAVIDNRATTDGGGIAVHEGGWLSIYFGAVISGNVASGRGGGIYAPSWISGSVSLTDIVANRAETGGGVYIESGEPLYVNFPHTLFAANQGGNCWFGAHYPRNATYTLSSDDSCAFSGEGNLASTDPLLFERDDTPVGYRLQPGSPAIDAGSAAAGQCNYASDAYGNVRPQDGDGDGVAQCDIGMYEFPASPSVPNTAAGSTRVGEATVVWLVGIGLLVLAAMRLAGKRMDDENGGAT